MSTRLAQRMAGIGPSAIRRFLADAPPDALDLGLGQVAADVPPSMRHALDTAPARERAPYGPNAGLPALRQAIAAHADVDPARVIVTCGVEEGLALAFFALLDPGDEVVVPDPAFPAYHTLASLVGARAVRWPMRARDGFRPVAETLEEVLTPRTRLVVLCSPGNPTGAAATPDAWDDIGALLAERGVACVSDEIYLPLTHSADPHHSATTFAGPSVVLGGLSKSHALAGWRIGWAIVPAEHATAFTGLHQHLVTMAPTLTQQAALAAFDDPARAWVVSLRATLAARVARVREALATPWSLAGGDGGLYVMARHDAHTDDMALATTLMHDHGVITIPGTAFGPGGAGWIRLSVGCDDAVLDAALDRLAAFAG